MGVERIGLALVLAAGLTGCVAGDQAQTVAQKPGYLSKFTPKPGADPAKLIGQKIGSGS